MRRWKAWTTPTLGWEFPLCTEPQRHLGMCVPHIPFPRSALGSMGRSQTLILCWCSPASRDLTQSRPPQLWNLPLKNPLGGLTQRGWGQPVALLPHRSSELCIWFPRVMWVGIGFKITCRKLVHLPFPRFKRIERAGKRQRRKGIYVGYKDRERQTGDPHTGGERGSS